MNHAKCKLLIYIGFYTPSKTLKPNPAFGSVATVGTIVYSSVLSYNCATLWLYSSYRVRDRREKEMITTNITGRVKNNFGYKPLTAIIVLSCSKLLVQ